MKEPILCRKHIQNQVPEILPATQLYDEEPKCFLNLNINSLYSGDFVFYPPVNQGQLLLKYRELLPKISLVDQDISFLQDSNMMFTQGSAEAIDLLIRAYCEPRDDCIAVTSPTFFYYAYRALLENVQVVDIPLLGANFNALDVERLTRAQAKILFLCNPNNPVGTSLSKFQIEEVVKNFQGLVVIDEAYIEWSETTSSIGLIKDFTNVVVLRTFSKIWGLAGIRCGLIFASENVLLPLRTIQTMFSFPAPCQKILKAAMEEFSYISRSKLESKQILQDLYRFLETLPNVTKIYPSETNFFLIEVKDSQRLVQYLYQNNILVKDNSKLIPSTIRISVGTHSQMSQLKFHLSNYFNNITEEKKLYASCTNT